MCQNYFAVSKVLMLLFHWKIVMILYFYQKSRKGPGLIKVSKERLITALPLMQQYPYIAMNSYQKLRMHIFTFLSQLSVKLAMVNASVKHNNINIIFIPAIID